MFTGLVEETGQVLSLERSAAGARLFLSAQVASQGRVGDSIAVNGCCLTAIEIGSGRLAFDLLEETLRRTSLGALQPGSPVNLERALPADGRLGGHFVQGHVDAAAEILAFAPEGSDHRLQVSLPAEFAQYVVGKGSICIDGISLTVAEVVPESLTVWIIPHTLAQTNLRARQAGDLVNLEFDLLAKYVERLLSFRQASPAVGALPGSAEGA